jgi:uncharacterized protein (TIGR02453 family)
VAPFETPFTRKSVAFLRSLKRNNDREWFRARKDDYERHVRTPMTAVIDQLARDFRTFAPELVASPRHSLYRIYRDTRFSADKRPLKTHAAASFPRRGLPRHQGAGLYFEISTDGVWMGGGMWAPEPPQLLRVREHIADTWPELQSTVGTRAFRQRFGPLGGDKLTRVPRGFPATHPAADYLKHYRFVAGREFPPAFAHDTAFYRTLVETFKALMPLLRFLNEPLLEGEHG